MSVIWYILLIIILLLSMLLKIGIYATYNLLGNIGVVKISIFGIPIISKHITFYGNYFNISKEYADAIKIKIDFKSSSIKIIKDFMASFISKLYIQKLYLQSVIGIKSNAYFTAFAVGEISSVLCIMQSYIKALNKDIVVNNNVLPNYIENQATITLKTTIYVCLYDIVWAILVALHKRSLYAKRSG